jgi:hypothetical protein
MIFWGDERNLPTFPKKIRKLNLKMVGRWYLGIFRVSYNPIISLISRFIQDIVC